MIKQQQQQQQQQQQMFVEENMSNLTSGSEACVSTGNNRAEQPTTSIYPPHYFPHRPLHSDEPDHDPALHPPAAKKKRSLPGNPDPEAEVIAMSPKSLLATNRFMCEICNKGFQRDQNLQLHRRGHNLPWKLKQRSSKEVKKKVYVCPEPSCVHHDPARALGDLTGIKKHFCRKHGEKKWKCDKCSKRYAVQSDWKAHSKVCGTREYRCDCGTLFSRRDSFITHRAFCDALAEETARAITTTNSSILTNPVSATLPSPSSSSSHHFMLNLQQQQQQQQQQHLHFNNNHHQQQQQQQQDNPLLSFPLKREQHLMSLPPWLSCPPSLVGPQPTSALDLHHHHHPSSSSSMIFHHDHQQQQDFQNSSSSNPSNNNNNHNPSNMMGPTPSSTTVGSGGPYHTQAALPHMSATALLQKAAQMGATMTQNAPSSQPQHGHVSDTTTTAGLFGLNLSSRDQPQPQPMVNNPIPDPGPGPGPGPTPSSYLHDMMINSLSSPYEEEDEDAFGIGGMLGSASKKDGGGALAAFQQTLGRGRGGGTANGGGGGGGGGGEGLTRDFLGLRPLSQSDILTMAGLGNCMTTTTTNTTLHNKTWQGN